MHRPGLARMEARANELKNFSTQRGVHMLSWEVSALQNSAISPCTPAFSPSPQRVCLRDCSDCTSPTGGHRSGRCHCSQRSVLWHQLEHSRDRLPRPAPRLHRGLRFRSRELRFGVLDNGNLRHNALRNLRNVGWRTRSLRGFDAQVQQMTNCEKTTCKISRAPIKVVVYSLQHICMWWNPLSQF